MAGITTRRVVVALGCPDARELAEFYAVMLEWRVVADDEYPQWVDVLPPEGEPGAVALACQTVPDFRAPTWPDGPAPAQVRLDFYVDSIADSEPAVLAAGARRHEHQPSPRRALCGVRRPGGAPVLSVRGVKRGLGRLREG